MNELLAFLVLPFVIPAFIFGAVWVSILLLERDLDRELLESNGTDSDES